MESCEVILATRPGLNVSAAWCKTHKMWIDKKPDTFEANPEHERIIKREREEQS